MNKAKRLKIINILLLFTFLGQAITGLGHDFIDHELFEKIHPAGGALLVLLVLLHVIFNLGWIKSAYFKKS